MKPDSQLLVAKTVMLCKAVISRSRGWFVLIRPELLSMVKKRCSSERRSIENLQYRQSDRQLYSYSHRQGEAELPICLPDRTPGFVRVMS